MSYSIRQKVLNRFNANGEYVARFGRIYPEARGRRITFAMIGAALAEFQMANTFANAPLDRFARGERHALTASQQRGALLFFTRGTCVSCHAVAGASNEMFTDFDTYVAGIPQIAPKGFGLKPGGDPLNPDDFPGNFAFSGPASDEDFGREEVTGDPADRYKFRTSPLRNIALQAAFFHNGSFTRLEDALRYHLETLDLAPSYDAAAAGLDADLTVRKGPIQPVLDRLEPRIAALGDLNLSPREFQDLLAFLRDGLLDPDARPEKLCKQIPETVPSGLKVLEFQGCRERRGGGEGGARGGLAGRANSLRSREGSGEKLLRRVGPRAPVPRTRSTGSRPWRLRHPACKYGSGCEDSIHPTTTPRLQQPMFCAVAAVTS